MIKDLIEKARSYRSFDSTKKIETTVLEELVDLARLTSSGANLQPLKYYLSNTQEKNDLIFPLTKWAAMLPNLKLPVEGHAPTAYIVVCVDTSIVPNVENCNVDIGLASHSIMLGAVEKGFGGCLLGAFNKDTLSANLNLASNLVPKLIVALGVPQGEDIRLVELKDGNTKYYRDDQGTHFVPKRSLEEIIIK